MSISENQMVVTAFTTGLVPAAVGVEMVDGAEPKAVLGALIRLSQLPGAERLSIQSSAEDFVWEPLRLPALLEEMKFYAQIPRALLRACTAQDELEMQVRHRQLCEGGDSGSALEVQGERELIGRTGSMLARIKVRMDEINAAYDARSAGLTGDLDGVAAVVQGGGRPASGSGQGRLIESSLER